MFQEYPWMVPEPQHIFQVPVAVEIIRSDCGAWNICYGSCAAVNHPHPKKGAFVCWCDTVLRGLSLLCIYTVYVCAYLVYMATICVTLFLASVWPVLAITV
jgi:hypothetical protein